MDIEIGIGISTKLDSTVAGREAARSAYYQLGRRDPNIIIVFISTIYSQADILKGIRSVLKGTPLIGCSSAASITPSGVFRDSVTVCALSSNSIRFSCAMGNKISKNARQAGSDAARESSSQKDAGKRRVYL
ncbi:MAG: FIST N-terminal domain-containing protein, partial [Candidatus Omnitrophota bacterium]|nr:FIST N-terminal domain-containing protein [Candidatus Omnitrophota bacterium]